MKVLLSKFIHIIIMPCNQVPMRIEQQKAGKLSFVGRIRLHAHLAMCKWCAAYAKKVEQIDRLLTKKILEDKKKIHFEDIEIQQFKDKIRKKILSKSYLFVRIKRGCRL